MSLALPILLLAAGILCRTQDGAIEFPYEAVKSEPDVPGGTQCGTDGIAYRIGLRVIK